MKKFFFLFVSLAMLMASCGKDTTTTPAVKGEKVVSFKVVVPQMQTRYGEGQQANRLFWAVYKDGERLADISALTPMQAVAINMSAEVKINLMVGVDYDILFWAQNENAPYSFDGAKVTIDYENLSANQESYDAFFRNYHVAADQAESHSVELRRPFAQLNVGTADLATAQNAGFDLANTSITVETCTVLDLATGEASEPQPLTFAMNTKASGEYALDDNIYSIIAMNYLLVNDEKGVVDVIFTAESANHSIECECLNIPIQRNHRTYILGNILTSLQEFNVFINPIFDDAYLFPEDDEDNDANNGTDNGTTSVIYYTSAGGGIVEPIDMYGDGFLEVFGANIVSNTYENGQGKIVFDGVVTKIGSESFFGRTRLTSIRIPEGVSVIENNAFEECENLTEIVLPSSLTKIESAAFLYCSISSITIPNSVIEIEDRVFALCRNLTNVNIPNGITHIAEGLFRECESLADITLPDSITEIDDYAFEGCNSLNDINIPNNVSRIGYRAFVDCYELTSITIPESVTEIGGYAFAGCGNLSSANIPSRVTRIEEGVFDNCALTDIIIPEGVTYIGSSAFISCRLTSVTIPNNVNFIGIYAFNCHGLKDFYCTPTIPPTIEDIFYDANAIGLNIHVPTNSVDDYKGAGGWWSTYADRIVDGGF